MTSPVHATTSSGRGASPGSEATRIVCALRLEPQNLAETQLANRGGLVDVANDGGHRTGA